MRSELNAFLKNRTHCFPKMEIIPPALWASGGLEFGCSLILPTPSPHPSEEGFTPPPSSSPGLGTGVPHAAVALYIRLFRHPGHHHFFILFLTSFFTDFGSILDPNLEPKWLQNRLQRSSFRVPSIDLAIFWLLQPLQWFLMVFGVPGLPKTSQNATKLL